MLQLFLQLLQRLHQQLSCFVYCHNLIILGVSMNVCRQMFCLHSALSHSANGFILFVCADTVTIPGFCTYTLVTACRYSRNSQSCSLQDAFTFNCPCWPNVISWKIHLNWPICCKWQSQRRVNNLWPPFQTSHKLLETNSVYELSTSTE